MKLVLATSNKGKVREIRELCKAYEVVPYTDLIEAFEIVEDADTFKDNALIKARAVYEALGDEDVVVIADDSGISVDVLGGAPGIYSARYAGENASDKENLYKLIEDIKAKGVTSSPAHYTAAIAIVTKNKEKTVHGWMYGTAITEAIGDGGFGYDPMFIPEGFDKTLGQLDDDIKKELSHRSKALRLARVVLQTL
ncbi:RdgB/HAM1 family non-canonical purine NTP pyrophosphatase [Sulfurimonas marina]|uniref:dITP/XTP pyrophosphatase n=1 Tax=Sulfurimonas marina TaxID=2590551 RepID=A0A7M1B019_9BACT|nr:RdgB/HAM1 family non-canonical purine NTP pyrophosphatase [Sulfurimonas marina]QOP42138.1 RdgB/HAM1 family non-canonical purine NTP pyrophosphatase [Sulfurimonas marina]